MRQRKKSETTDQIDISPLIDMVFILLIFFMVSTTFVKDMKLNLDRPGASMATAASSKSIRVYVDKSQNVYLEGARVRIWTLQSKLREVFQSKANKSVLVVIDKKVPSERLIQVVDYCKLAGAKDVGVATEKEAGA